jgi:hypothetical protein
VCVALISTDTRVFIGVQKEVTDLVKSITHQAVVGQPWSSAATGLQLGIPLYHLLESVTAKPNRERLHGGAGRPPPEPTGQQPLHSASSCQVDSQGDTYFGGIPNFLVISRNAPIWHLCSQNQINTKIVELG